MNSYEYIVHNNKNILINVIFLDSRHFIIKVGNHTF